MSKPILFARLTKVDERTGEFWCDAAVEEPDKSDEIFDYASSRPNFEAWSAEISKATNGKSVGNLRAMHQPIAAGKLVEMDFDDTRKAIPIHGQVIDPVEREKLFAGVYTGVSIGGDYAKRWVDPENPKLMRYTALPSEISLVDNPAIPSAHFQLVKQDGSIRLQKFHTGAASPQRDDPEGATMDKKLLRSAVRQALVKIASRADVSDAGKHAPVAVAVVGGLQKLAKCYPDVGVALGELWMPVVEEKPSYAQQEAWDVSSAIYAIDSLARLAAGEADSKEPAQVQLLMATMAQLWQFIGGELAEILAEAGGAAAPQPAPAESTETPSAAASKVAPEAPSEEMTEGEAMQMAARLGALHKAGARLSGESTTALHAIRDQALALCACAKCGKMAKAILAEEPGQEQEQEQGQGQEQEPGASEQPNASEENAEGVEKQMKLAELKKYFDEWSAGKFEPAGELQKLTGAIPADDKLQKMIGDALAPLAKAADLEKLNQTTGELSKRIDGFEGRLQVIEKQPDPRLPVLRVAKRDGGAPIETPEEARTQLEKLLNHPALSEDARRDIRKAVAFEEIKQTMQKGPAKLG